VIVEHKDANDGSFIHYHKSPGRMALYEIIVTSKEEGQVFEEIIPHEEDCDQSRRR
jgi:hypothetical protein